MTIFCQMSVHYILNALEGFFQMPRTSNDARILNWTQINTECLSSGDHSSFAGFRYEHPADDGVVLIFDVNGIIAGIQARVIRNFVMLISNLNLV